ncbi:hypothetical protein PsorP6_011115 [Peronosclerospora sorghi]|uniref:Uncharacterized protein n=1 Tax=Peronosclerospora sorghi TaxID=230839 RepID=A0ACC0VWM8_9STRA|nr:hypothetical protein PsorP6_011115 [Peronosclerospora sorghi]
MHVADFATLVTIYDGGFILIIDPFNSASGFHNSLFQLPVIITPCTLSPIYLYPRLLNFNPGIRESLPMSVYRSSIVTCESELISVSTKFDPCDDLSVLRIYGTLLLDGGVHSRWHGLFLPIVFLYGKDHWSVGLAWSSEARALKQTAFYRDKGHFAEGIDFDRHYGRALFLFGIPFQYTLSNTFRARLEYLRYTHQIREGNFLTFDALRQASQCAGEVYVAMLTMVS